jgi:hypothetical protein
MKKPNQYPYARRDLGRKCEHEGFHVAGYHVFVVGERATSQDCLPLVSLPQALRGFRV